MEHLLTNLDFSGSGLALLTSVEHSSSWAGRFVKEFLIGLGTCLEQQGLPGTGEFLGSNSMAQLLTPSSSLTVAYGSALTLWIDYLCPTFPFPTC